MSALEALADPLGPTLRERRSDAPRVSESVVTSPPESGWASHLRIVLAFVAAGMIPVIGFIGTQGFAALVAILGLGSLVFISRRRPADTGFAILLVMVLWAVISMIWSPATPIHPNFHSYKEVEAITGFKLVLQLALYGAFVMAMQGLPAQTASQVTAALGVGVSAMMVLACIEFVDGQSVYLAIKHLAHQKLSSDLAARNVARTCYVASLFFWPLVLRLRSAHRPLAMTLLVAGLIVGSLMYRVDAPVLALILASASFAAVRWFGRPAILALMGATILYIAGAPLIAGVATHFFHPHQMAGTIAKQSWAARMDIWRFAVSEIDQRPFWGWGLEASRAWPSIIPMHPHNAALQIWLELGVLGVTAAALFWAWLYWRIALLHIEDRSMAAAAAASAVAYLTIGAISFGVWQEWWLALGALSVVMCRLVAASRRLEPGDTLVPLATLAQTSTV